MSRKLCKLTFNELENMALFPGVAPMDENLQDLDYPYPEITIKRGYLEVVDRVLLAVSGRMWELLRDMAPYNRRAIQTWSYSPEELRTSHLGQSLLTIADYAGGGYVPVRKVERSMKRAYRILCGESLTEGYKLPPNFNQTELGQLFNDAYLHMYHSKELMTPKQAYTLLDISRQSLYDRANEGKLQKIYLGGKLRFIRVEIEEWQAQREVRQNRSKS